MIISIPLLVKSSCNMQIYIQPIKKQIQKYYSMLPISTIDPRKKLWMEAGLESKSPYVILTTIKSIKLLVSKYAEDYLHYMLLQTLTTQVFLVEKGRCNR